MTPCVKNFCIVRGNIFFKLLKCTVVYKISSIRGGGGGGDPLELPLDPMPPPEIIPETHFHEKHANVAVNELLLLLLFIYLKLEKNLEDIMKG